MESERTLSPPARDAGGLFLAAHMPWERVGWGRDAAHKRKRRPEGRRFAFVVVKETSFAGLAVTYSPKS